MADKDEMVGRGEAIRGKIKKGFFSKEMVLFKKRFYLYRKSFY